VGSASNSIEASAQGRCSILLNLLARAADEQIVEFGAAEQPTRAATCMERRHLGVSRRCGMVAYPQIVTCPVDEAGKSREIPPQPRGGCLGRSAADPFGWYEQGAAMVRRLDLHGFGVGSKAGRVETVYRCA
jgi:hypothetical protein